MTKRDKKECMARSRQAKADAWATKDYIAGHYADKAFYRTPEWRQFQSALIHGRRRCEVCNYANRRVLVVRHRVSRLMAPELAFNNKNALVLCGWCDSGMPENNPRKGATRVILRKATEKVVDTTLPTPDNQ